MVEPPEELKAVFDNLKDAMSAPTRVCRVDIRLFAALCAESPSGFDRIWRGRAPLKHNVEQFLNEECDDIKIVDSKRKPKKTSTVERALKNP